MDLQQFRREFSLQKELYHKGDRDAWANFLQKIKTSFFYSR